MQATLTPFESQLAEVQEQYPAAVAQAFPSGAKLVTIPNIELTEGWSKNTTTIQFVAPNGFPHAQPDCFWADADLRLQNGGMPQNASMNVIPETGITTLWFSWHLNHPWNPNRDTLLTWIAVIRNRLREAR